MPTFNKSASIGQPPNRGNLLARGPELRVEVHLPISVQAYYKQKNMPIPPPVIGTALIDTGATTSAIDDSVVVALGLVPKTTLQMVGATGSGVQNGYVVHFVLPELIGAQGYAQNFVPQIVNACPTLSTFGLTALLGRDLLSHVIMIYDGTTGDFSLSW